jgi:peroxiredoxin
MTPHLVKWHEQYSSQGLSVISVDNGSADPLSAVQQHVERVRLPVAVLHDANGALCNLYGVHSYPTQYVIGRDGKVTWEGQGYSDSEGAAIEREIQRALSRRQ